MMQSTSFPCLCNLQFTDLYIPQIFEHEFDRFASDTKVSLILILFLLILCDVGFLNF